MFVHVLRPRVREHARASAVSADSACTRVLACVCLRASILQQRILPQCPLSMQTTGGMQEPIELQQHDVSSTHTPIFRSTQQTHTQRGRYFMYNESVNLMVRPGQDQFTEQRSDTFMLKQLDVVRCWLLTAVHLQAGVLFGVLAAGIRTGWCTAKCLHA